MPAVRERARTGPVTAPEIARVGVDRVPGLAHRDLESAASVIHIFKHSQNILHL